MKMKNYAEIMREGGCKTLNKSVFRFSNNAVKFLDGITANDMGKDANAFLDRLGKLIALADQKIIVDEVYIIIEEKFEGRFLQHINSFIKFSKTKMEKLDLKAVLIINGNNNKINKIIIKKNIGFMVLLKNDEFGLLNGLTEISD